MNFYIIINEYGTRITSLMTGLHGKNEKEINEYFNKKYGDKNYSIHKVSDDIQNQLVAGQDRVVYVPKINKVMNLPEPPGEMLNPIWRGQWIETANREEQKKDAESIKDNLIFKAKELKLNTLNQGFIFKDNLRQPCRERDKTSITAKVVELQFTKKTACKWKFYDKDTNEHIYTDLTLEELAEIGIRCAELTLKAMQAESGILEDLKKSENLENYDVEKKFKEYMA